VAGEALVIHATTTSQWYFLDVQMLDVQRGIRVIADDLGPGNTRIAIPPVPLVPWDQYQVFSTHQIAVNIGQKFTDCSVAWLFFCRCGEKHSRNEDLDNF